MDVYAEDSFSKKLTALSKYINLDELTRKQDYTNTDVKQYYKTTKYLLYRVFGHPLGYMHMAVLKEGYKKPDFQYHPKRIAEFIIKNKAKNVLEIGCGQGANINYLAKKFPKVQFTGIDLYPTAVRKDNVSIYAGDYHDLKQIKSASMDIVYAIETLCYSTNKQKVHDEVYRVLKKNGVFVIWDGYLNIPQEKLTRKELKIIHSMEHGFYVNKFEYIDNMTHYSKRFKILKSRNMKDEVLSFAIKSQKRIETYMKFGILFKIFCKIFPKEFINNLAPIYLMADSLKYNLSAYYELEYKK